MDIAIFAAGTAAAFFIAAGAFWTSYLIARRRTGAAPASARFAATAVIALWLFIAAFWLLAFAHAFRIWVALPLWIAAAVVAHRTLDGCGARRDLASDLRRVHAVPARLGPWRILAAASLLVPLARFLRALAAPPIAWDSLTYHLVHAARWVQSGGFDTVRAPDAWGYYAHFPAGGETLWAWAMLPVHGDALLAVAGLAVWASILLGVYAASRALGANERVASLGALAAGLTPAFASLFASGYVDDLVLALFALGAVFVIRALRGRAASDRILALAALAACSAVKISAVPALATAALLLVFSMARARTPRFAAELGAFVLVCLAGAVPYVRNWVETGSPVYPISFLSFPANEEFGLVHRGAFVPVADRSTEAGVLLRELFWGTPVKGAPHINLGISGAIALLLGAAGVATLFRRRKHRAAVVFLLVSALVNIVPFFSAEFAAWRILWWSASGRLLGIALAAFAILGSSAPERSAVWGFSLAIVCSLVQAFPLGFGASDLRGIAAAAAIAVLSLVLIVIAVRRMRALPALAVAVIVLAAASVPLAALRAALRYRITAEAADERQRSFDVHPVYRPYAGEWPVWKFLDQREAHRIAVAAGWDDIGHNWLVYPLFGSRLQNHVEYVPITHDGSIVDYRSDRAVEQAADGALWRARLDEKGIDFVVVLPPLTTAEARWLREHPGDFELVAIGEHGSGGVYRVKSAR